MRFWLVLVSVHLVLSLLDAAVAGATSVGVDSWEKALEPWGLNASDGLSIAEIAVAPKVYFELISRIVAWDYSLFAGSTVGTMIRSLLIAMTAAYFIKEYGASLARSVSRFIPFLR
ncbi:MAG: hypothetical protein F4Y04_05750 [Chloroflexi bacterium]|nr:hypothetical protein [Chloroflexota bacterium]